MIIHRKFISEPRFVYYTIGTDSGSVVAPGPPQKVERRLKSRF